MRTVKDVVMAALESLGVYGPGQPLAPEDAEIGRVTLNRLLDSWRVERIATFSKRYDQIPIPVGTTAFQIGNAYVDAITPGVSTVLTINALMQAGQSITIDGLTGAWSVLNGTHPATTVVPGVSATIAVDTSAIDLGTDPIPALFTAQLSMPRPTALESGNYVNILGQSFDLHLTSSQEWARKPSRSTSDSIVTELYCDYAYPLATCMPWPIPNVALGYIELWSWCFIGNFATIDAICDLPPGYEAAVVPNLAVDLATAFTREPSQTIVARAVQYKAALGTLNRPPVPGLMAEMLAAQPPQSQPAIPTQQQ